MTKQYLVDEKYIRMVMERAVKCGKCEHYKTYQCDSARDDDGKHTCHMKRKWLKAHEYHEQEWTCDGCRDEEWGDICSYCVRYRGYTDYYERADDDGGDQG